MKILSSITVFNTDLEHQINVRKISKESCDSEDRSNDAENSALPQRNNYILKYIKIETK